MSKFLKHFTVVGDDYHAWNINYKKWENEEEEEEEEQPPPQTPASGEEGRATDPAAAPVPLPRPRLDFRSTLRKLFSAHRFQVGGRAEAQGAQGGAELAARVTRAGWGPISGNSSFHSVDHVPHPALGTPGRSSAIRGKINPDTKVRVHPLTDGYTECDLSILSWKKE